MEYRETQQTTTLLHHVDVLQLEAEVLLPEELALLVDSERSLEHHWKSSKGRVSTSRVVEIAALGLPGGRLHPNLLRSGMKLEDSRKEDAGIRTSGTTTPTSFQTHRHGKNRHTSARRSNRLNTSAPFARR